MKYIRKKLIQFLVKNLLAATTEEDILTITNRGWMHQKRKLSPEEVTQLQEDGHSFKDSVLWNYMKAEVRYQANLRMFEQGVGEYGLRTSNVTQPTITRKVY
jgi:hypothetical protein